MRGATAPGISRALARLFRNAGQIAYALLTHSPLGSYCYVLARLACIRHSTSVRSEPGSNSSLFYKVCPGTLSLSVNVIDRSITQAHLQILQSACPDPVRGVSWPFPTGTRPIIEIPTESSRGSCADFCEFPRFFSYNACLPSKRRQKPAYFHIVHNQSTHPLLFRRHFF